MSNVQNFLELGGFEIRERLTEVVELLKGIQDAADADDTSACRSLADIALELFNVES